MTTLSAVAVLTRLLGTQRSFFSAVVNAAIIVILAGLSLSALSFAIMGRPVLTRPHHYEVVNEFIGAVLLNCPAETLLLVFIAFLMRQVTQSPLLIAAGVGLVAGIGHGSIRPTWFLSSAFAFFIFTFMYETWRHRSFTTGFWAACLPHMASNSLGVIVLSQDA